MAEKESVKRCGLYFAPAGTLHGFAPAGSLHIYFGWRSPNKSVPPMTDKQFDTILRMVAMILDGCKDLEEAKGKLAALLEERRDPSVEEVK
jgi:hypothetical protein